MLYNVREYHRPTDIDEAIRLLKRPNIHTVPLAGGVTLVGEGRPEVEAVVDLDALGLDFIEEQGSMLRLGAMVRLQAIVDHLRNKAGGVLADAAHRMAGYHVRNAATLGGVLASGGVHSPLAVVLAVLGAHLTIYDGAAEQTAPWLEIALQNAAPRFQGSLLTAVTLDLPAAMGAAYEQVARTPADHPIVCAAAMVQPTGGGNIEAVVVVGGLLKTLRVVHTAALETVESVAEQVTPADASQADYQSDYLGSAEYRRGVAPVLARRALHSALAQAGLRSG